ncbi:putative membrane protein YphA (DoxX/SURF4 family) [Algoriphagus sp. 4150]|uniref:DoxX family protein n=1 Tax=Algoriphagus sp. 4150 TaxID=2817756 RepID=UPI0028646A66|nr:DoxX family protein [Algoriphagus sp. 4150]MDR7129528.1 putative membrane protein YphA (DoxX/SURF4 family) [Algoriphagus sp. 4150]
MDKNSQSKLDRAKQIIHWVFMPYFIWQFGYASLAKVFQYPEMMGSMVSLGFNQVWTLTIGYLELIGWVMVLIGLFKPKIRILGILFLFPFSIGAFTAHMAHQEYVYFYASLIMCISCVVLLWSSKNFSLKIV